MWEFSDNRAAPRYKARLLCRISTPNAGLADESAGGPGTMTGYTRDLSTSGLAIILSTFVIGHRSLRDFETLLVQLELPTGHVEVEASPVRIQRLDREDKDEGYLVGLRITKHNDSVRERLERFLYTLG